jgi:hypothetical protein
MDRRLLTAVSFSFSRTLEMGMRSADSGLVTGSRKREGLTPHMKEESEGHQVVQMQIMREILFDVHRMQSA